MLFASKYFYVIAMICTNDSTKFHTSACRADKNKFLAKKNFFYFNIRDVVI